MNFKFLLIAFFMLTIFSFGQQTEPWKENQLMKTNELASRISLSQTENLLIVSIGPDAVIKGSVDMGPAQNKSNLDNLRNYLEGVSRDKEVVIYCGCCPFSRCPNIRPAFSLLIEMGFKDPKLVDIPQNIRVDWLSKKYPVQ